MTHYFPGEAAVLIRRELLYHFPSDRICMLIFVLEFYFSKNKCHLFGKSVKYSYAYFIEIPFTYSKYLFAYILFLHCHLFCNSHVKQVWKWKFPKRLRLFGKFSCFYSLSFLIGICCKANRGWLNTGISSQSWITSFAFFSLFPLEKHN